MGVRVFHVSIRVRPHLIFTICVDVAPGVESNPGSTCSAPFWAETEALIFRFCFIVSQNVLIKTPISCFEQLFMKILNMNEYR